MNTKSYFLKTISTGLLLLILFSSVLFVLRKINMTVFYENAIDSKSWAEIEIWPSGLAQEQDKFLLEEAHTSWSKTYGQSPAPFHRLEGQSSVTASIGDEVVYGTLGIVQMGKYFDDRIRSYYLHSTVLLKNEILWALEEKKTGTFDIIIYRDSQTGLLVHCRIERQADGEKEKWVKNILGCAGSEKAGETIDSASGRFSKDLLVSASSTPQEFLLFDRSLDRFCRINFKTLEVVQGPELSLPEQEKPIRFLVESRSFPIINMNLQWRGPWKPGDQGTRHAVIKPEPAVVIDGKMLILTANGQVKWLDVQTLQIVGTAGFVPENPHCQFKDMLTYDVQPVVFKDTGYQGLITGSISRFPNRIDVNVFDKEGKKIGGDTKSIQYGDLPGGPIYLTLEFLLENLHSPILLLGSFFTSPFMDSIEAHQGMLLLPASFVGQLGFEQDKYIARIFIAIIFSLPAILLSVFLAWRVHRDAVTIGLDRSTRRRWFWCTLAMGLVAYLTYRMTRPAESLVTCENCGKLRRPDRTRCHRCGAAWNVPELTAPAWRIYTPKAG